MLIFPRSWLVLLPVLTFFLCAPAEGGTIWKHSPPPKFPQEALKRGSEGYVVIRAFLAADGTVKRATVGRSSGDATLDEAARTAMLKWRMQATAVKPAYLTKGYDQRIDFKQEAPAIAQYRDRIVYFESFDGPKTWISALAPEYPYEARRAHLEGTTYVKTRIGPDGKVVSVEVAKSSGSKHLDVAALNAVRWWRARKEYAGKTGLVPVTFTMHPMR